MRKLFCRNQKSEINEVSSKAQKGCSKIKKERASKIDSQRKGRVLWRVSVHQLIKVLTVLLLVDVVVSIYGYYWGNDYSPIVDIVACVLVFLLMLALFSEGGFSFILQKSNNSKDDCTFLSKEECPYSSIKDCPHNTSHCCAFKQEPRNKWKINLLALVLIVSLVVYVITFFIVLPGEVSVDIIKSICLSVFVASVMAFLVDIPGKMKEYQSYFVDLLSSNEYLKQMDESALMDLRAKITWILHSKDIPNMPKGLIDLDGELCDMLRKPFFRDYSQINDVRCTGDEFVKTIKTQYSAFNPYGFSHPVIMDIGLGIEMIIPEPNVYDDDASLQAFVEDKLSIKRFCIIFDDRKEEVDLRPYVQIVYKRHGRGEWSGNQDSRRVQIHLINKDENRPVLSDIIVDNNQQKSDISVKLDENRTYSRLDCEIKNKIQVELDYIIKVTNKDKLFSKKLRYPVKYLYFEYAFDKDSDYEIDGQLIGTMIDPSDRLINVSEDRKRITMRTNAWLLPRNGVVVVINKKD